MRRLRVLLLLSLAIIARYSVPSAQEEGWASGELFLSDSTSVKFVDIVGSFVFYGGGKGGALTHAFPVRMDTAWRQLDWKLIKSVEVISGRYGKIERWPCLRSALVEVVTQDGLHLQCQLDCLFWIEVRLPPDDSGLLATKTFRFFTVKGKISILKILLG